jgi:hypothetical protein
VVIEDLRVVVAEILPGLNRSSQQCVVT